MPEEAASKLRPVAVRCLCDLLASHPHFNFRTDIISCIVPLMCVKTDQVSPNTPSSILTDVCIYFVGQISATVCDTVKRIFKEDKSGEVTLEVSDVILTRLKNA